jgi:hypothetical protein
MASPPPPQPRAPTAVVVSTLHEPVIDKPAYEFPATASASGAADDSTHAMPDASHGSLYHPTAAADDDSSTSPAAPEPAVSASAPAASTAAEPITVEPPTATTNNNNDDSGATSTFIPHIRQPSRPMTPLQPNAPPRPTAPPRFGGNIINLIAHAYPQDGDQTPTALAPGVPADNISEGQGVQDNPHEPGDGIEEPSGDGLGDMDADLRGDDGTMVRRQWQASHQPRRPHEGGGYSNSQFLLAVFIPVALAIHVYYIVPWGIRSTPRAFSIGTKSIQESMAELGDMQMLRAKLKVDGASYGATSYGAVATVEDPENEAFQASGSDASYSYTASDNQAVD